MTAPDTILTTKQLAIGYRAARLVRTVATQLQLRLHAGRLVCLLGSNGVGKSTLMRTLAGLQPPLEGEITIDGRALSTLVPGELAQKLSLVLTDRIDTGNLTAREVVEFGRTPYTGWLGTLTDFDLQKVAESIQATGISPLLDRQMHKLSDGERQKVMLARALAQDTPLILLDEPTAHLDLPNRVEMMRLLHRLARNTRKAILLSTHELDLALQTADEIWLMHPGGALSAGVPEDLVLNGSFEAAFARNGFTFDRATGAFAIHHPAETADIYVEGSQKAAFWLRRALHREGFGISRYPDARCTIHCEESENGFSGEVRIGTYRSEVLSIEAVILRIREIFKVPDVTGGNN